MIPDFLFTQLKEATAKDNCGHISMPSPSPHRTKMSNPSPYPFFRKIGGIDILRAIAVLGVIANHVFGLSGGFLGVDVFFVISGYVITLLLIKEHLQGQFKLTGFYLHRIARIIPPLFVVSIFVYACQQFAFWIPEDYQFIQDSFFFSSLFAQNLYFVERSADYFQGLTNAKLNLHLWSLAVEEQFYIAYPFLFIAAFKFKDRNWMRILVATVLAVSAFMLFRGFESFIAPNLNAIYQALSPSAAKLNAQAMRYYLLPTRAWQLFLGAVACVVAAKMHSTILGGELLVQKRFVQLTTATCLLAIVLSMLLVKETMAWPSPITLLPAVATAAILVLVTLFDSEAFPYISKSKILALIGRSSYSLYLWHWPILGILIYTNRDFGSSALDYFGYFFLLAILTAMTYYALEQRRHYFTKQRSAIVLAAFIGFSLYVSGDKRPPDHFPSQIRSILETGAYAEKCKSCDEAPSGRFIVLWGDSHSRMLVEALEQSCAEAGLRLVHLGGSLADDHQQLFFLSQQQNYTGTILAMRWSMYAVGFPPYEPEETGDRYLSLNGIKAQNPTEATEFFHIHLRRLITGLQKKPVIIFEQVPSYPFMPKKEAIMEWKGLKLRALPTKTLTQHEEDQKVVNSIFAQTSAEFSTVQLIDPAVLLCPSGTCVWRDEWKLLYKDDDHLSVYGADRFRPVFSQILSNLK